jgi:hypothetical protein
MGLLARFHDGTPGRRLPGTIFRPGLPGEDSVETSPVQDWAFVYDECGMVCEEKMRLLAAYRATTSALFTANNTLDLKAGAEFRTALTAAEAARAKCVKARLALQDHKTRCETCGSVAASKHARSR